MPPTIFTSRITGAPPTSARTSGLFWAISAANTSGDGPISDGMNKAEPTIKAKTSVLTRAGFHLGRHENSPFIVSTPPFIFDFKTATFPGCSSKYPD